MGKLENRADKTAYISPKGHVPDEEDEEGTCRSGTCTRGDMYTLRDMYTPGDMYRGTCGGPLAYGNGLMCRLVVVVVAPMRTRSQQISSASRTLRASSRSSLMFLTSSCPGTSKREAAVDASLRAFSMSSNETPQLSYCVGS